MAAADRTDPYLDHRFLVELDGLVVAGFVHVSGLTVRSAHETYHEGGVNEYLQQLPTRRESPPLVLNRGVTGSESFLGWMRSISPGTVERRTGRVIVLDEAGREVQGYQFYEALPVSWSGPELSATDGGVAVESVELVHRGLTAMEVQP